MSESKATDEAITAEEDNLQVQVGVYAHACVWGGGGSSVHVLVGLCRLLVYFFVWACLPVCDVIDQLFSIICSCITIHTS